MYVRKATADDYGEISAIYEYARGFMASHGNPNQWGRSKPAPERIILDISLGKCYVCIDNERVACAFFYDTGDDPTYAVIDGSWRNDAKYGVVHRIASAQGTKGAATFSIMWAYGQCGNLRMDTHDDNIPMRNLLSKLGFVYCGTIWLEDGSPRRAYQKC